MIVVDTNIIAYLYLPGELTAAAESLLEREPDWAAPWLWRSELRNILAGYIRRRQLALADALHIQSEAEDLLDGLQFEADSEAVLHLVSHSDCSAYDCEFVALANQLGTRVVTMDKQLLRAFPEQTLALRSFLN